MGHLTAPQTERKISEVEVVSDDSLQVLLIGVNANGVATIRLRDASGSNWSSKVIATLDKQDAAVVATILEGGHIAQYGSTQSTIDGLSSSTHTIEKPESEQAATDSDCTALDIERAKAQNLLEERHNIELQLEREHSLDQHVRAFIHGCPACERAVTPGHGDGSLRPDDTADEDYARSLRMERATDDPPSTEDLPF